MKNTSDNFWNVYWGPDDAKGDEKLNTYFIKIPEYDQIKNGHYRYIIGRKGTGKTAIIEQLINDIQGQYDQSYKYLSLKNFPIQTLRNLKDRTKGDKSQYVPIWTFLLLTELCKLIVDDESCTPTENVHDITLFIRKNFPSELGFNETLKVLAGSENKVSILSKWVGGESSNSISQESLVSVHFQQASEILLKLICSIKTESRYYLFFDELDEGYSVSDKSLNLLLLALFRAIENTFINLKDHIKFRPVMALRSDIYENLEDNDLNKLDDYIINLKWTTESRSQYSLLDLVNARINASIIVSNPNNAWNCISYNNDNHLPRKIKSLWDYIYNRTFERPRDIIKYMKICSKLKSSGKINFSTVKAAERDFSEWFFKEFRDEIQSHLPVWQQACQAIIKLGKGVFTLTEIKNEMNKDSKIINYLKSSNKTHEDILEKLFEFGVIGNLSSSKWFFKYKDHNLPFNPDLKMLVHFGFAKKFRISTY